MFWKLVSPSLLEMVLTLTFTNNGGDLSPVFGVLLLIFNQVFSLVVTLEGNMNKIHLLAQQ